MGSAPPHRILAYLNAFLKRLGKSQRIHFLVYLVGLIWFIKFRSIREIARIFGQGRIDSLHQFLTGSARKLQPLQEELRRTAFSQITESDPLLTIDDTACPRNGKAIEGIGIHHSGNGLVKGLCAVTAILKSESQRWAWAIRGYRPKKTCPAKTFKSKIQLAIEILMDAVPLFAGRMLTVLMDSWYSCAKILNFIHGLGWRYVAAIRKNRVVLSGGRKINVSHLAKGLKRFKCVRLSKHKRFRIASLIVRLPKIGNVRLFVSKQANSFRFYISNDLDMTELEMARLYSQRFWIETFHQEIKQHLGFREVFMRSWTGVQTHWTLVAIAYNLIGVASGNRSRSFRQKIRAFRDSFDPHALIHLPKKSGALR